MSTNQRGTKSFGVASSFGAVGWKMVLIAVQAPMVVNCAVDLTLNALCFGLVCPFVPGRECC